MGSDAYLRGMQCWSGCLFLDVLYPVPSLDAEAPKIRHLVSVWLRRSCLNPCASLYTQPFASCFSHVPEKPP